MAASAGQGKGSAPEVEAETVNNADPREQFHREQREAYVDQLEHEIAAVEAKIAGMKETLVSKREELKQARAAARKDA